MKRSSYSPAKASVDSAVRYAESKGVLLVHAAGNEGENNDETPSFPTPVLTGGTRAANWIEVGASSWKPLASLPAGRTPGTTSTPLGSPVEPEV